MIEELVAEVTECDFKVSLETRKPKNCTLLEATYLPGSFLSKSNLFNRKK